MDLVSVAELLAGIAINPPHLEGARCRTHPDRAVWDAPTPRAAAIAADICTHECPCLQECRAALQATPAPFRPQGVIAGEVVLGGPDPGDGAAPWVRDAIPTTARRRPHRNATAPRPGCGITSSRPDRPAPMRSWAAVDQTSSQRKWTVLKSRGGTVAKPKSLKSRSIAAFCGRTSAVSARRSLSWAMVMRCFNSKRPMPCP